MITLGYASAGGELMMRTNTEAKVYTRIKVLISREHPEKIQDPKKEKLDPKYNEITTRYEDWGGGGKVLRWSEVELTWL